MIYLDHAATTPIREEALIAFTDASKKYFGNASSLHDVGQSANDALEQCRVIWANLIEGSHEGIYFTSGGTESNQLAILSYLKANKKNGNHIITTEVEHSSIYNLCNELQEKGFDVTFIPLQSDGTISLEDIEDAVRPETILASIHHGNNEVGFIQPIKQLGALFEKYEIFFHVDCVQTFGQVPISVQQYKIDALSIASHKIYGPKGIGLCYMNPSIHWESVVKNTTHEYGFRPGTVDVPSVIAFTLAGQLIENERNEREQRIANLRKNFINQLTKRNPDVQIIQHSTNQLQHIIGIVFPKVQGQYIMLECNKKGVAISTGSACQVGMQDPSRTLLSIGRSIDESKQLIRISLGRNTTEKELVQCTAVLSEIMEKNTLHEML